MDRFQLATLALWSGDRGLQGRKRLQKVVYFLQQAGCPLVAGFTLHHYGPYSRDIADVCDELVIAGMLEERKTPNVAGTQFSYHLLPDAVKLLERIRLDRGDLVAPLDPYRELALDLFNADLWSLELGSTILYFFAQSGRDWNVAVQKACEYKKVPQNAGGTSAALKLAQRIIQHGSNATA